MVVALRGTFIHAAQYGSLEALEDRLLVFDDAEGGGEILAIGPASDTALLAKHALRPDQVVTIAVRQLRAFDLISIPMGIEQCSRPAQSGFLIPGFVDTHLHAPQYRFTGTATDLPLMKWLQTYTLPTEARMRDLREAQAVFSGVVGRTLAHGTTTVLYFATLDLAPSKLLADTCKAAGQRAFVGKVAIDRNSVPGYAHSPEQNLREAEEFDAYCRSLGTDLVQPVVTPRFVPTCSKELLQGLGDLAARQGCCVQSHISESSDNQAFVADLHPQEGRDAVLYEEAGLLTARSVMAHGVCLTEEELGLLARRGTAIAHCPLSNFFFAGWPLDVAAAKRAGVKVGLGTDVAGGYSPSMLSAMRHAVVNGKALQYVKAGVRRERQRAAGAPLADMDRVTTEFEEPTLDFKHAFYLATRGGAEALGLQDTVGGFEVGKKFDALLIDTDSRATFDVFPGDTLLDRFQKFINLGDDRNIRAVWVNGQLLHWS